jgi:hypothetical protein
MRLIRKGLKWGAFLRLLPPLFWSSYWILNGRNIGIEKFQEGKEK